MIWLARAIVYPIAGIVCVLGMVLAFGFYAVILAGAAAVIRSQTGVVLDPWKPAPVWFWAPTAMIALGALAGILPAIKAYRSDVAQGLAPES